jgi:uncharacterized protein
MRAWLTAAIMCCALCAPGLALCADYSPLACSKARSPSELTMCRTYSHGQAEARMATVFGLATSLVAMGQRGDIRDRQSEWLKRREACGSDVACLSAAYDARIAALDKVIDDIASRGPY